MGSVESDKHQKNSAAEELKSAQRSLSLVQKSKFADPYHIDKLKDRIRKLQQSLAAQ